MNATANTEIYTYGHTLSLHDALPIFAGGRQAGSRHGGAPRIGGAACRPGISKAATCTTRASRICLVGGPQLRAFGRGEYSQATPKSSRLNSLPRKRVHGPYASVACGVQRLLRRLAADVDHILHAPNIVDLAYEIGEDHTWNP